MRDLSKPLVCQVVGCKIDLSATNKKYCRKKRACTAHLAASSVQLEEGGPHLRFCQQCGKFEPLTLFDGDKRSCRKGLLKRCSSEKRKTPMTAAPAGDKCKTLSRTSCYPCTAYSACCSSSGCCGVASPHAQLGADTRCCAMQCTGATAPAQKKIKTAKNQAMSQQLQQQQQLEEELLWASQQQLDSFHCKSYEAAEAVPEPSVPDDIVSRAVVDLAAELAYERQLQQQKQAAAATAATSPVAPAYVPGAVVMKADSSSGSDTSSESMLAPAAAAAASCVTIPTADAGAPALTATYTEKYTENALDELLDVLYEECAAEAAAATGGLAFEDPTAAVAVALQCCNSDPNPAFAASCQAPWAVAAAPITPALPATQQRISAMHQQIAALQAQLLHLQQLTAAMRQQQQHLQYRI